MRGRGGGSGEKEKFCLLPLLPCTSARERERGYRNRKRWVLQKEEGERETKSDFFSCSRFRHSQTFFLLLSIISGVRHFRKYGSFFSSLSRSNVFLAEAAAAFEKKHFETAIHILTQYEFMQVWRLVLRKFFSFLFPPLPFCASVKVEPWAVSNASSSEEGNGA